MDRFTQRSYHERIRQGFFDCRFRLFEKSWNRPGKGIFILILLPFKCAILIKLKVDNLFKASRNFFQLPENVKKGYPRDRENFDGYTGRDQEM
jgi:hypothetical protein